MCFLVCKSVFVSVSLLLALIPSPPPRQSSPTDGFTSEGEYLEITEINRQQAGEYECITANGVSTPDSKRVLITVNCEWDPLASMPCPLTSFQPYQRLQGGEKSGSSKVTPADVRWYFVAFVTLGRVAQG